ncbi:MAG TPA: class I SAM-dependent methyltransferase [Streptosporangiaceae bacterium]
MPGDRERLRITFDSVASRYHQARPNYPAELYDELVRQAQLRPGDRVLEVGCATGKATVPLAQRGFEMTCIELGADLAEEARRNLSQLSAAEVINEAFETWKPPPGAAYDLVFAATAWHWIDPAVRYQKAWELLRPGGHLAFWGATHVFPADGDPFFHEIQDVYDEIGEGIPGDLPVADRFPSPDAVPDQGAEIARTGLFTDIVVRRFDWEIQYTADEYIRLLDTFSGHIAMAPWQRDRLYSEIRLRLDRRPDGRLRRHWGAVLHVACRR